jgi:hypothetical protein
MKQDEIFQADLDDRESGEDTVVQKSAPVVVDETEPVVVFRDRRRESQMPAVVPATEVAPVLNAFSIIETAIREGVDADQLQKLVDMREQIDEKNAARAWTAAMADFQATCPTIKKTEEVDGRYTFPPLDEVMRTMRPHLARTGLSVRFDTELSENGELMTAYCYVMHRDGHTVSNRFAAPVDRTLSHAGNQLMNCTQQVGSARSYCKRYAVMDAFWLVGSDLDDDGYAAGTPLLTDRQIIGIRDQVQALGINENKFCEYLGARSLELMPASKYPEVEAAIRMKEKTNAEAGK